MSRSRPIGSVVLVLLVVLVDSRALAQAPRIEPEAEAEESAVGEEPEENEADVDATEEAESEEADEEADEEAASGPPPPRRAIPDYGRAPETTDAGDAFVWIPRVVFFPLHLFFEYVIRTPLAWIFRTIELERLDALFVRGVTEEETPSSEWWFVPMFRYDHGFEPTAGILFNARDRDAGLELRAGLDAWPLEQIRGRLAGVAHYGDARVRLSGTGSYRTDRIYHGLGWGSAPDRRARYARAWGRGQLALAHDIWRRTRLATGVRVDIERMEDSGFQQGDDVSIEDPNAVAELGVPPRYPDGYTAISTWLRAVIDTRENTQWAHASGVRAELFGEWGADVRENASWARASGFVQASLEVERDRTVRLRGRVEAVEPLGPGDVPFTRLIWLGGDLLRMPGFLEGRLIGHTAATVGVSWRYAIWTWLDADLFFDVGNVFGRQFEDFHVERLRMSFGAAITTSESDDFTLLFALGTEPFVNGTEISSIRFAFAIGTVP